MHLLCFLKTSSDFLISLRIIDTSFPMTQEAAQVHAHLFSLAAFSQLSACLLCLSYTGFPVLLQTHTCSLLRTFVLGDSCVFLLSAWSLPHFLLICTATFSSLESPPKLPSLSSSWLYIVALLLSSLSSNTLYLSVISSVSHPTTSAPPKQGLFSVLFAVVSPALCLVYIMWSTDFCQMSK